MTTATATVFSNADLLQSILAARHRQRPTLHLRAASRTCRSWRDAVEAVLQQAVILHAPFCTPLAKKGKYKVSKIPQVCAMVALEDGCFAILGPSTLPIRIVEYDASGQPQRVLEVEEGAFDPHRATSMHVTNGHYIVVSNVHHIADLGDAAQKGLDHQIRLIDRGTGLVYKTFYYLTGNYYHECLLSDGALLISSCGAVAEVCLPDANSPDLDVLDGTFLVLGKCYVLPLGRRVASITVHNDELFIAAWKDDGRNRFQASSFDAIYVFSRHTTQVLRTFGASGHRPGEFGHLNMMRAVNGRLLVFEGLDVTYAGCERLQVLTLTGEPVCEIKDAERAQLWVQGPKNSRMVCPLLMRPSSRRRRQHVGQFCVVGSGTGGGRVFLADHHESVPSIHFSTSLPKSPRVTANPNVWIVSVS